MVPHRTPSPRRSAFRQGRPSRLRAELAALERKVDPAKTPGQAMNESRREEALRKLRRAVSLAGLAPAQRELWDLLLEHLQGNAE